MSRSSCRAYRECGYGLFGLAGQHFFDEFVKDQSAFASTLDAGVTSSQATCCRSRSQIAGSSAGTRCPCTLVSAWCAPVDVLLARGDHGGFRGEGVAGLGVGFLVGAEADVRRKMPRSSAGRSASEKSRSAIQTDFAATSSRAEPEVRGRAWRRHTRAGSARGRVRPFPRRVPRGIQPASRQRPDNRSVPCCDRRSGPGPIDAGHRVDRHDDWPFQPFGSVHGVESDGFLLRVGTAFDRARFIAPGRRHGLGERAKASYRDRHESG